MLPSPRMNLVCTALLRAGLLLACGCAPDDMVRLGEAEVLYSGAPYGDFLVLADAVRECMDSDVVELPRLLLVDRQVECRTVQGWKWVLGCEGHGEIILVAPVVTDSHGSLWAHELTHYFGAEEEGNRCGSIRLDEFSLVQPDAG